MKTALIRAAIVIALSIAVFVAHDEPAKEWAVPGAPRTP